MSQSFRANPPDPLEYEAESDRLFVKSAAKAVRVLSAFHAAHGPLSLSEIAKKAAIDRSSAQRIVHTLMLSGHLRRSADDQGYLPGIRLLDHTLDVLRLDPVIQKATPVLLELRKAVRERVDLSLFHANRLVYALRMQSKRETFYATLVGHSVPLYCTAGGRAILAVMPEEDARAHLGPSPLPSYTRDTRTDVDDIMDSLKEAQRDGFAIVIGEFAQGEIALGVAITQDSGEPLGAIHVAGSLSEWTPDSFIQHVAPLATAAAREVIVSL
ncbi:IclR family transcriptional regulator [Marivita sp. S0852]|uniref:IclR family transcriptional regulator n=1 Tax=Marivita sp. S0852 TaxID=3373893 RepID=UPI0039820EAA